MSSNIKELLIVCDLLCYQLLKQGKFQATKKDIGKIPQQIMEQVEDYDETKKCNKCDEPLKKVGENWRCETCDRYCNNCGAHTSEDDKICPECGIGLEEEVE